MSRVQQSGQSAYDYGRVVSFLVCGALVYGAYGLVYWLITDSLYFGPWEWGLVLITSVMTTVGWKTDERSRLEKEVDEGTRKLG